jgi:hypothetical protein
MNVARGEIGPSFGRLMWLTGAALALIASAVLMALVVPVLAVLPLFAVPMVLATRAADHKRGQAEQRGNPGVRRTRWRTAPRSGRSSCRPPRYRCRLVSAVTRPLAVRVAGRLCPLDLVVSASYCPSTADADQRPARGACRSVLMQVNLVSCSRLDLGLIVCSGVALRIS